MTRSRNENTPLVKIFVTVLLTVLALTPAAHAQITSPPPAGTNFLYAVPGVVNALGVGTYFACTSVFSATQTVTAQIFGADGASVSSQSVTVAAGATTMFGTQGAAGLGTDTDLTAGFVLKGSARILSTSKSLICTAFLADATSAPPTSMVYLTIVAKTKQKGE